MDDIGRRSVLYGFGALAVLGAVVGIPIIAEKPMQMPMARKDINGKPHILADVHAHISRNIAKKDPSGIVGLLTEGLTAMTEGNGHILTYKDALDLCRFYRNGVEVTEIDRGRVARIRQGENVGYVAKSQELYLDHHVLAIGCREPIKGISSPYDAIKKIKSEGGIAVLAHPYLLVDKGSYFPRLASSEKDLRKVMELAKTADAIEVFNAHSIDFLYSGIPPIEWPLRVTGVGWMKRSNGMAQNLQQQLEQEGIRKPGIAVSDAHSLPEQARGGGIYIPDEDLTIEGIRNAILSENFSMNQTYVRRWSFLKSRCYDLMDKLDRPPPHALKVMK